MQADISDPDVPLMIFKNKLTRMKYSGLHAKSDRTVRNSSWDLQMEIKFWLSPVVWTGKKVWNIQRTEHAEFNGGIFLWKWGILTCYNPRGVARWPATFLMSPVSEIRCLVERYIGTGMRTNLASLSSYELVVHLYQSVRRHIWGPSIINLLKPSGFFTHHKV